jgi:CelD/BcsL family acetyltransferase involved in cellulose biosynthesis
MVVIKVQMLGTINSHRKHRIDADWNTFMEKYNKNPFLLSEFVNQYMELSRSNGWNPIILTILGDDKIVGALPLKMKNKLGVKYAKFLFQSALSPDLVGDDQYLKILVPCAFDYLFKVLRCRFLDLTLPAESSSLQIIKQTCEARGINFRMITKKGHRILPINYTWTEIEKQRKGSIRQIFARIERKMKHIGSWKTSYMEKENDESNVMERILQVEKMSWKEMQRTKMKIETDQDLMIFLRASYSIAKTNPEFSWCAWFLELDGKTLAYMFSIQYKKVAFMVKTSYDIRYSRFSPGIYLTNIAIRELFNEGQVRSIDFLTDLPFMKNFTSLSIPRVRIMISPNTVLLNIIKFAVTNKLTRSMFAMLSKRGLPIAELID